MYRLMQPSDEAAVLALWQSQHHDTEDFAKMVLERFAGMQNIYVADENDAIVAAALAVPVTLQGRTGKYLCLCGEGSLLLAGLLDTLCAHQKLRGAGFTVTVPADAAQAALLQDKGFAKAFALRCLPREVSRNLWSQAEFDTVTAKKLCELREQFWKDTVQLSPERMAVVLQELYARGATIVSNEHGYGIYFRKEDTLYFVEMMADSDRAAEILMEAAREKERAGYVERVRGIGTVVNRAVLGLRSRLDQKLEYYPLIRSFGSYPHADGIQVMLLRAGEEMAHALALEVGDEVICIKKRILADTTPVIYSIDYLPRSLFGNRDYTRIDLTGDIFEILEQECHQQISSNVAHLKASCGDEAIRAAMRLAPGEAMLLLDEVCFNRLCRPVMRSLSYYTNFFDFSILRKLL